MQRICGSLQANGYYVELIGVKRKMSVALSKQTFTQKRIAVLFEKSFLFYAEYNLKLFFYLLFTIKMLHKNYSSAKPILAKNLLPYVQLIYSFLTLISKRLLSFTFYLPSYKLLTQFLEPMEKITILIADDHKLIRETWSFILNNDKRFSVVDQCASGSDAVRLSKEKKTGNSINGHQYV